jgi:hypothetical protein
MEINVKVRDLNKSIVDNLKAANITTINYKGVILDIDTLWHHKELFSTEVLDYYISFVKKLQLKPSEDDIKLYNCFVYINQQLQGKHFMPLREIGKNNYGEVFLVFRASKKYNVGDVTNMDYLGSGSKNMFNCIAAGETYSIDDLGLPLVEDTDKK